MVNGENGGSKEQQKLSESKVYSRNSSHKIVGSRLDAVSEGSLSMSGILAGNGQENSARINLSSFTSKREMRELRRKLQSELDLVRRLVKKIEATDAQKITPGIDKDSRLSRMGKKLESSKPLNQLSVSVLENSTHGVIDNVEKEKRTPKVNQLYRNSDFLSAKDKFPPAESNKKSKSTAKKESGPKFSNQILKNCRALLERLMKHKHGWVFNQPVDTAGLGLLDYFDIIKNPMDLGTVKSKLETNQYKSPKEFAEDVRLTFQNAMTYNQKGQDVHVMAEQLSKIFEEKWATIEADYMRELRLAMGSEVSLPTPKSKKLPSQRLPPPEVRRTLDRSESTTNPVDSNKTKSATLMKSGRTPTPQKPKAKDPNKREMTYDEKQKLSTSLQDLPSEKLEIVVQIIKKRNSSLCQQDDEIEVDIDSVDTETLWELDRFLSNYKKSLSKNKRKAEHADEATSDGEKNVQEQNPTREVVEIPQERTEEKGPSSGPAHLVNQGKCNSQSSSSRTNSVSSSSDSDGESSSGGGSDAEHSPKS